MKPARLLKFGPFADAAIGTMLGLAKKSHRTSMILERNVPAPMRDGVRVFANLFRPAARGPWAVIISVTPYGKDKLPDRLGEFFMRLSGVKFGKLNRSRFAGFESPDPSRWIENGYAVVQADVRGMHQSEGQAGNLRPLAGYFAVARRGLEAAASPRDRSVGGSYRPLPGTRVSRMNTRTRFVPTWFKIRIQRAQSPVGPITDCIRADRSRGSNGYSREKNGSSHGRKKWETFYSEEALALQKRFLSGVDNGMIRERRERESRVQYRSTGKREKDRASCSFRFDKTTELTGSMRVKL